MFFIPFSIEMEAEKEMFCNSDVSALDSIISSHLYGIVPKFKTVGLLESSLI
jgi:plasmid replication initiation protein